MTQDLTDLTAFVTVARAGGFREGARAGIEEYLELKALHPEATTVVRGRRTGRARFRERALHEAAQVVLGEDWGLHAGDPLPGGRTAF